MGIKDILVHVDDSADCNERLRATFNVAKIFDSHVSGLYVPGYVPFNYYGNSLTAEVYDAFELIRKRRSDSARKLFENECEIASWRTKSMLKIAEGDVVKNLVEYSAYNDLLVLGQVDLSKPENRGRNILREIPVESSSPTLLIPYIGTQETIGKNVLIAWDGSREAARAIHISLPFLKRADVVNIISIGIARKDNLFENDIGDHLSHHGVVAKHHYVNSTSSSDAESLLSWVSDFNADLLVMGIYGHTRLREYIIGGMSRTILESATVPVLLSH
jgi:nucleotide-binding universal stress UspA family protein